MKHFTFLGMAALLAFSATAQPRSASEPALLLSTPTGLMAPVWSPDGSQIAVTGNNYTGIMVANANGSDFRMVTDAPGAGYKMVWNGEAEIVGRTNQMQQGRVMHEMCAWNVATGSTQVLVPLSRTTQAPTLRAAGRVRGVRGIYEQMMSAPDKVADQVEALSQFSGEIIINPALSPDGSRIAFQVPGKGMWMIYADGTNLQSIGTGSHPAWMPDNATIVYTIVTDNGNTFTSSTLMAMNVNNGKSVVLTARPDFIPLTPAVAPDGSKIAFENAVDNAIYVVTLKY